MLGHTWRGQEGDGDTDIPGDLVTSQDHPGQVEETHLEHSNTQLEHTLKAQF